MSAIDLDFLAFGRSFHRSLSFHIYSRKFTSRIYGSVIPTLWNAKKHHSLCFSLILLLILHPKDSANFIQSETFNF